MEEAILVRQKALELAIAARPSPVYNGNGGHLSIPYDIVGTARIFESFLTGK